MSEEEQLRDLKQNYLIQHIKDQKYDYFEFASFLAKKKQGGDDVDAWTL